jgi:hypothetical protein
LIPETGVIIQSRNVVFEEGLGHRTLTPEGEYFQDEENDTLDSDLGFLHNHAPVAEGTPPNQNTTLTTIHNAVPVQPQPNPEPAKQV